MELDKLYILPGFKGFGIRQQFLQEAIRVATREKDRKIWLNVLDKNEPAISFYRKAGFVLYGTDWVSSPNFKEEFRGMWRMVKEAT